MLARSIAGLAILASSLYAFSALPSAAPPAVLAGPTPQPASVAPIAVSPLATSMVTSGEAILQIHDDCLTSYLASSTGGQGISPNVLHRGVGVDGAARRGSGLPLSFAGNPFGGSFGGHSACKVDLATGSPMLDEVDLRLPAPGFSWVLGRSFSSRQQASSSHTDSDGPQGSNWFQMSAPEIALYDDPTDAADDVLYLVTGADAFVEYKRVSTSSDTFRATNGAGGAVLFEEGATNEPDTYTVYDMLGNEAVFFGFDADASPAEGQLWKVTDPADNTAYLGDPTTGSSAIALGFTAGGLQQYAIDSADRRYTYSYTSVDGTNRLTSVVAETKDSGDWFGSPVNIKEVGRVEYSYYSNSFNTFGQSGDLELVTTTTPLSEANVTSVKNKYFRYWQGTYNASTNPGHDHSIRAVLDWEGARNLDHSAPYSYRTASYGGGFDEYLMVELEYDSSHRVSSATVNGCGCGGGATGEHEFTYGTNGSHPAGSSYDEEWLSRTIVEQPDGLFVTQYFDEAGQALSQVKTDGDPSSGTPDTWATRVERNADGTVSLVASPANENGYTHSTGAITASTTEGLISSFVRETTGETDGYVIDSKWQEGSSGTAYYNSTVAFGIQEIAVDDTYVARPHVTSSRSYFNEVSSSPASTDYDEVTYSTTFRSSSLSVEKTTTTLPAVSTSNNGSGSTTTTSVYLNADGTRGFAKSPSGLISYWKYKGGLVIEGVEDADTTKTAGGETFDGVTIPSGFSSSGAPLHRVTEMEHDTRGRRTKVTDPYGDVHRSYVSKLADERIITLSYPLFKDLSGTDHYFGPVSFSVSNHAGSSEASGSIALSGGSADSSTSLAEASHIDETESDPLLAIDLGTVVRYSTSIYNETGKQVEETRAYFDIPASGAGTDGTNFDPTKMAYDVMGRRIRTLQASGTITRTEFDGLGRATSSEVGTDDTGDAEGMTGGTNNMTQRSATVYDGGSDGGNGFVTRSTRYWGSTSSHTDMEYDARGRTLLVENPVSPHQFYKYDNRGRQVAVGSFSSTASITVGSDDPTTETTNRLSLSESTFDSRGRAASRTRHSVNQTSGATVDSIDDEQWFDEEGRLVKVTGSSYAKYAYDRIGRRTHTFLLGGDNDSTYADADDVTGDIVLEENQTAYDADGRVVMQVNIQRFHDDDSAGTTGALDTNADGDWLKVTAADLEGRASITGIWYETHLDRQYRVAQYGTNGGATFNRGSAGIPSSSANVLVTEYVYDDDGHVLEVIDPMGRTSRTEVDDLGRTTVTIANYEDGTPSGTDSDQRIVYGYTDGLRTTITADVPSGGTDQVTTYTYGTTKGVSAGDSEIATGHLLQKVAYPDSTGASDVVSYAYDRQGRQHWVKDQAGTIIETTYDVAGRQTERAVTTLASGFNGDVRRIETSYTNRGQVENVTQYDAATSGNIVDQVEYAYTRHGGVEYFYQDMNSAVNTGSGDHYTVQYAWELSTGGRESWRRNEVTLPSGAVLEYAYSSGIDDEISRQSMTIYEPDFANLRLAEYDYLGYTRVVGQTYAIPDLMQEYFSSTSGDYPGLDRFGRVVRSRWQRDTGSGDIDIYDVELTYDLNSNITLAEDAIIPGRDVQYTMDELNRLVQAEEGTWSGSAITSTTRDEEWTLDHLGNWDSHQLDLDGDGVYTATDELDETRTHNAVNELLTRDLDSDMSTDESLTYNAVGQLTDDDDEWEYVYDAFGRLCEVKNQSAKLVAEYRYNGLGFQIGELTDTNADGDVDGTDLWYYSAFDERWRKLATFRSSDSDPKEEFVPHNAGLNGMGGSSYINDTVLRDKDADTAWEEESDGLEQRIFYLNNWRGDVVGLVTSDGYQGEFVRYSAYGTPFNYPGGDADSDGDADAADGAVISGWASGMTYDLRGDLDLDGDVDAGDSSAFSAAYIGVIGGHGQISAQGVRAGYAGMEVSSCSMSIARNRVQSPSHGVWTRRDPLEYIDSLSMYSYALVAPHVHVDPNGTSVKTSILDRLAKLAFPQPFPPPPPSIFGWLNWSYGNYCGEAKGPLSSPPPQPVNFLDSLCQEHDKCYSSATPPIPGGLGAPFSLRAYKCNKDLCDGLLQAEYLAKLAGDSGAEKAAGEIYKLFCGLGLPKVEADIIDALEEVVGLLGGTVLPSFIPGYNP